MPKATAEVAAAAKIRGGQGSRFGLEDKLLFTGSALWTRHPFDGVQIENCISGFGKGSSDAILSTVWPEHERPTRHV